ncbi:Sushi, von Willebrand factor type A, EGF and pentraxin domain-containing protein 1 [Bagarius yarrelli]|uniref:Sushi, von Willebrand factor type A, EGF and pentraxin domain-containing protein 1 n=1 Tax=Bagarius yarrelli TaxID=175774 RepID=A0A556U603_BAGYA|nr:Sushi, von Willebrand factor type A, EGF and pentraxin domain-containing protein 1 [Bagarius yarrelli]
MAAFSQSSSLLWIYLCMALLAGACLGGSDSPRGVSLPFVFDLKAVCDPPCRHAGICIRNSTCLCSRGYEGETCQYDQLQTKQYVYSFAHGFLSTAVCKKPCLNGGKCVSPDKCRCRAPFSGSQCEERKKLF